MALSMGETPAAAVALSFGATAAMLAGQLLQRPLDPAFLDLLCLVSLLVLDCVLSLLPLALSTLDQALRLLALLVPVLHALSLVVRHELSKSAVSRWEAGSARSAGDALLAPVTIARRTDSPPPPPHHSNHYEPNGGRLARPARHRVGVEQRHGLYTGPARP